MANKLSEPWRSFLDEIDRSAPSDIALNCIGGFAVSLYYGLARPTGDIDVVDVTPTDAKGWLATIAQRRNGSATRRSAGALLLSARYHQIGHKAVANQFAL